MTMMSQAEKIQVPTTNGNVEIACFPIQLTIRNAFCVQHIDTLTSNRVQFNQRAMMIVVEPLNSPMKVSTHDGNVQSVCLLIHSTVRDAFCARRLDATINKTGISGINVLPLYGDHLHGCRSHRRVRIRALGQL